LTVSYTWVNALTTFFVFLIRVESILDSWKLETSVRAVMP
jgi:hypothetical protein